ncbi:MAG: DNA polymerase III subunit epsilon [Candidatus Puniceispirillum sp.]|nr:DNA polymerase III subunit epsilon [Candidatus Pelagibacter sp.]MBA4283361.1 DNA polymerase III subunit epsilon [Candidatus Puniceispirillum sp.]
MRFIILDTETTGLNPSSGDRIIEIGCIEMIDHQLTGEKFHTYINPERDVPLQSTQITGLTSEFLRPFPIFKNIAQSFLDFIKDDTIIIHNAPFDVGFINNEFKMLNHSFELKFDRVIDTLQMARKKFPGSPASLDALCKRFNISLAERDKHGALIDVELLSRVYLNLIDNRQSTLSKLFTLNPISTFNFNSDFMLLSKDFPYRSFEISNEEQQLHQELVEKLSHPIWNEQKQKAS